MATRAATAMSTTTPDEVHGPFRDVVVDLSKVEPNRQNGTLGRLK
jgi:hypothetical protein